MCRVPVIFYTPHCFYFQGKNGLKKNFYLLFEKVLAKITTGIILSENEKEQALQFDIIDSSKLHNINNAINFYDYCTCDNKKDLTCEFDLPMGCIVIGAIGRLEKQKGWDKFILIAIEILNLYK